MSFLAQYYNRYANHEQSSKLEKDLYLKIEKKMEEIQISSNLSWIEVQFMKRAVDTLSDCRTTLKWTYAMAYYLKKNEKIHHTELFEDNQR
jgi:ariadne-1